MRKRKPIDLTIDSDWGVTLCVKRDLSTAEHGITLTNGGQWTAWIQGDEKDMWGQPIRTSRHFTDLDEAKQWLLGALPMHARPTGKTW